MWETWVRSLGWKGCPLQHSGLENSMDCIVHGVAQSQTRLSDSHFYFTEPAWEAAPNCGVEGWGSGLEYAGRVLRKPQVKGLDDSLIERMKERKEKMAKDKSKGSRLTGFPPLLGTSKNNEKKTMKIEKRALMMWNSQQIKPPKAGGFFSFFTHSL